MKKTSKFLAKYTLFAAFSIAINLLTQFFVMLIYTSYYAVELSILCGTFTGLMVKFNLDKHYIFYFTAHTTREHGTTFILYTLMGTVTTLIFWFTEYTFYKLFEPEVMRYIGAILGLVLGFIIKFQLDKRFVFINRSQSISFL